CIIDGEGQRATQRRSSGNTYPVVFGAAGAVELHIHDAVTEIFAVAESQSSRRVTRRECAACVRKRGCDDLARTFENAVRIIEENTSSLLCKQAGNCCNTANRYFSH